jgi:signal peptide peptidase-like protein 2B
MLILFSIYAKLILSSSHAGLFLTYLALFLMDGHGQPALLYLVPCTLGEYIQRSFGYLIFTYFAVSLADACIIIFIPGLIVLLGWIRGELPHLWNYGRRRENFVDQV